MISVVQFCVDVNPSSGVNTFVTELDRELCAQGVDSRIIRTSSDLQTSKLPNFQTSKLLLHIHGLWRRELHRAAQWARRNGVPVVWSTHGMTAPWAMRHKRWKKIPAWWLYQRRDLQDAAQIHCTSEQEVAWNRKAGLVRPVVVVPLGSRESGSAAAQERADGALRVLFVGRLHPVKGLLNVVRAARGLAKVEFRVVGPDQTGYLAVLQAEAKRLGVDGMFAWVGPKYGTELSREYASCDLLILPSESENFGGVAVDAMAHGKPVLASDKTPWKTLEEQGCGWWVSNAPEILSETLRKIAAMPREALRTMGARGRELVEARYTWAAVAKRMAEVYQQEIARWVPGPMEIL